MGNGNNVAMNERKRTSKDEKKIDSKVKEHTPEDDGAESKSTNMTKSSMKEYAKRDSMPYQKGDRVLAKVSRYPWWPGQIIRYKPMNRDGITIEKSQEHLYKVQFFPNLDFAWVKQTGLKPLTNEDISNFLASLKKKSKYLKEAYEAACEPPDIESEESTEEEKEPCESEDSAGDSNYLMNKKKRKNFEESTTETNTDLSSPLSTMSSISSISEMYGKSATSSKVDLINSKLTKNVDRANDKGKLPISDSNHRGRLSPLNSLSSEMKTLIQRLLYFRFKLQKLFLSSNITFEEDDLYQAKVYLRAIEDFPYLNYEMIVSTKIAKVLKRIALLDDLPKDEIFCIRGQCKDILYYWKQNMSISMESSPANSLTEVEN
ncbi:PWWP domain-containing protein Pdp1 [Schizosaccharomyces cryophilus OY26]|uniref:PWWP domain-containing protein Pdp1 n=1 Tax=Schizosaccharomyces cryophilus (strain OY26 / ATCC MYA-4695 / CBS 11777 / NBRC 106824 / NRRL Y48691) TaxID=653667 RepID=S9WY16_SCHCR|nr:PWWP domain-containing protein Pdp1 [Schizosaccharomyces cryophilus OY26]EPY49627.1 PWWP domain-containing protein Pdp1 [Schizosaccharomyces cryophilus OY26]